MKDQKGITLISLIVYILLMTLIIALLSNITVSFYTSINNFDRESESAVAFSKFNMYFLNDIRRENSKLSETTSNTIVIVYGGEGSEEVSIKYSIKDKALYRNKVKICDGINDYKIVSDKQENTVTITLTMGRYRKTTKYKIENYIFS